MFNTCQEEILFGFPSEQTLTNLTHFLYEGGELQGGEWRCCVTPSLCVQQLLPFCLHNEVESSRLEDQWLLNHVKLMKSFFLTLLSHSTVE